MKKENQQTNSEDDCPVAPIAGVVYGDIIYWGTIAGTFIVIAGSIMTFVTKNNYIDPNYLLSSIWEGRTVEEIWTGAVGAQPDGHWYLSQLGTGNGLTAGGIALSIFSVIPGILGAAFVLFREKQVLFGSLAIVGAIIILAAMIG